MSICFQVPVSADFWNGYLDWSQKLRKENIARCHGFTGESWRPVFIRSKVPPEDFTKRVGSDPSLIFVEADVSANLVRASDDKPEMFIYVRSGESPERDYYEILHIGTPVNLISRKHPIIDLPIIQGICDENRVGIGIIDDGIGYLNARFCKFRDDGIRVTRFGAIWLQSITRRNGDAGNHAMGAVLNSEYINSQLAGLKNTDESWIYDKTNAAFFPDQTFHTIRRATTHGTHMLDLVAGEDPAAPGPLRDVPILAVQLPPESVDDTSGVRLETDFLMGIRWLIAVARKNGFAHLIINASLGVLAGPKDGTKFIEQQMVREIEAAKPMKVEIVLPFGSEYETRQVAMLSPRKAMAASIDFIVQREDLTPSFIEIRSKTEMGGNALKNMRVSLALPDGSIAEASCLPQGQYSDLLWKGNLIARLYHMKERSGPEKPLSPYLVLALAPSALVYGDGAEAVSCDSGFISPPGRWTLTLDVDNETATDFTLQIQRDDSAVGYRQKGRQAYFDDQNAYDWNPRTRDYTLQRDGDCPIRYSGTNNAYATSKSDSVFSIGSARVIHDGMEIHLQGPASYASEGADWSLPEPDGSAVSETGLLGSGVTASGNLSGSAARLSGSSAAAATFSRHRILLALSSASLKTKGNSQNKGRLGSEVIIDNPSIRRRG